MKRNVVFTSGYIKVTPVAGRLMLTGIFKCNRRTFKIALRSKETHCKNIRFNRIISKSF